MPWGTEFLKANSLVKRIFPGLHRNPYCRSSLRNLKMPACLSFQRMHSRLKGVKEAVTHYLLCQVYVGVLLLKARRMFTRKQINQCLYILFRKESSGNGEPCPLVCLINTYYVCILTSRSNVLLLLRKPREHFEREFCWSGGKYLSAFKHLH